MLFLFGFIAGGILGFFLFTICWWLPPADHHAHHEACRTRYSAMQTQMRREIEQKDAEIQRLLYGWMT